jgi:hypothetical protein
MIKKEIASTRNNVNFTKNESAGKVKIYRNDKERDKELN